MSGILKATRLKWLAVVVLTTLCTAHVPARAQEENGWFEIPPEVVALCVLLAIGEGYLMVGGSVVGVGNLVYASRGEQSTPGWRNQGYVLGALNMIVGGIMIGSGIKDHNDNLAIFGAVQAGIGAADLGLTIWSQCQENGSKRSLAVTPLVLPTNEGPPAMGIGVQLVGW